jgi:hypothetical protein
MMHVERFDDDAQKLSRKSSTDEIPVSAKRLDQLLRGLRRVCQSIEEPLSIGAGQNNHALMLVGHMARTLISDERQIWPLLSHLYIAFAWVSFSS